MGCKSALYGANTSPQTVPVNGVINFGNIIRRYGSNISLAYGMVSILGSGYYDIDTSFTFTAGTGTSTTITLYKDGVAIPGANATFSTTAGSIYTMSIPAIVRQICCCESNITAVVSGADASIINTDISVTKL